MLSMRRKRPFARDGKTFLFLSGQVTARPRAPAGTGKSRSDARSISSDEDSVYGPDSSDWDRQMKRPTERTLAISLALIAGYVDACSVRTFGTYVSFMSGNTTQTGALFGQGQLDAASPFVVAIVCFVGRSQGRWLRSPGCTGHDRCC